MKILKFMIIVLLAMCGLNSCSEDCDHEFNDVDYSKSIIGVWSSESETYEEAIRILEDGKFMAFGNKGEGDFYVDGTWKLHKNRLVLTTSNGTTHFSGTIQVYAEDVMLMTSDGSKDTHVYHYYVDSPFPKSLVGTWTCLEANFAEALTINEDGSLVSTRLEGGNYWDGVQGTFMEEEGAYGIELNGDYSFGSYEVVSGELLVLINNKTNTRRTYRYCKEDLSEEIVGMWVCNETPSAEENDMLIMTYKADGTTVFTGYAYEADVFSSNVEASYKVIGDLLIHKQPDIAVEYGLAQYNAMKIKYTPNGTALGDVKTLQAYAKVGENYVETNTTWLRIKQTLDLPGQKYDYIKTFVTNVKGEDKDIPFLNTSFNFAKMDGSIIDKFLKSILFTVEYPDANTIKYSYLLEGQNIVMTAPIEVEGNKMTIKMSENNPVYKDVVVYTFQDQDNTQMHWYMPTSSFENFFGNTSVAVMLGHGQLDINDAEAIAGVYKTIAGAVESINLSLVMTKGTK